MDSFFASNPLLKVKIGLKNIAEVPLQWKFSMSTVV